MHELLVRGGIVIKKFLDSSTSLSAMQSFHYSYNHSTCTTFSFIQASQLRDFSSPVQASCRYTHLSHTALTHKTFTHYIKTQYFKLVFILALQVSKQRIRMIM